MFHKIFILEFFFMQVLPKLVYRARANRIWQRIYKGMMADLMKDIGQIIKLKLFVTELLISSKGKSR